MNEETKLLAAMLIFTAAMIVVLVGVAIYSDRQWTAFASAHACRVIGQAEGRTGVVVTTANRKTGVGTVYVSGQTGWLCDDGVTYWR